MDTHRLKILAIDDQRDNLMSLEAVLTDALPGCTVLTALDGHRGIALAREADPDAILLDIVMPGMDGFEVCRRLKADEGLSDIPVIFLTALGADRELRVRALEAGAEAFLSKPPDELELLAQLRAMARLKIANRMRRLERDELAALVAERTQHLEQELAGRRRAEQELAQTTALLEHAGEKARVGGWELDVASGRLMLSREASRIHEVEFSQEPLSVAQGGEYYSPEVWPVVHKAVQAAIEQGTAYELEVPFTTAKGNHLWVHVTGFAVRENGKTVKLRGLFQDITERKQAEEAIRREEKRSGALIENAPDGIVFVSTDGKFTYASPSAIRIFGYDTDEISQLDPNVLTHPDDLPRVLAVLMGVIQNPLLVTTLQYRFRHQDRRWLWIESTFSNLIAEPSIQAIVINFRDITARKQAEDALRASQQLAESIIESIPGAFYMLDEAGKYVRWNAYQREVIVGKPDDRIAGMNALETIHPEDRALVQARIANVLREGTEEVVEGRVLLRGGPAFIWMLMTGRRMMVGGQPFLVGTGIDITEQKKMEAERLRLEDQIRASQKMEAIGSLAGGVAHDFNNLLSVILSYTGFAMEAVRDGDPLQSDLLEVKNAAERAAALTRQLLAFSRKQVLQPVALDLNQVATGVEKMLRRILGEDIELVQTLAPDLGLTLADPGQIEQVLMNLVVNARDAMPAGGRLTIETSNVEIDEEYAARHVAVTPGSYVQLAVSDTGCGMDGRTREHLFEPFFTTKEKGKGTGLGLSTVYGIVQQSGGNIWVYSEQGQGTTFKVYLPRERSATTATVITPPTVPMRSTGNETILVVEDEEALRNVARRSLEAAGYQVLTAADGDEALLKSAQHEGDIHLLLTDVVMPRMGGRDVAQALLKMRPTVKVLYMSGYTDNTIGHHGALDAETHFLAKPFTSTALKEKVRAVLDAGPLPNR